MKYFLYFFCFSILVFLIFSNVVLAADVVISENTIWEAGEYVIDGDNGLVINAGVILEMKPGVVVKLKENNAISVLGKLEIKGELGEPVVLTSFFDGNGSPAPGDWYGIVLISDEASVEMDYASVRYGGKLNGSEVGVIVGMNGNQIEITNSEIINNAGGIIINSVDFEMIGSNFYNPDFCQDLGGVDYCGSMLRNVGAGTLAVVNNYWGHANGPTITPPAFYGTWIFGTVDYEPFASEAFDFSLAILGCTDDTAENYNPDATEDDGLCEYLPDPVIIVPGILGSWEEVIGGEWKRDPIFQTYENLWEALQLAGYEEGVDLFDFPYDWRMANTYTAGLLKEKINEVKEICDCEQVDIVAHSMGGLVARAYIEFLDYEQDIDQLIFLATPHLGSVSAYLTWEGGKVGWKKMERIQEILFKMQAEADGFGDVYSYVSQLPMESVKELLPVYDYLRDKESGELREYANNYPQNLFLELLNHETQLAKLTGINIINIVADAGENSTINYLRVVDEPGGFGEWEHGYPEKYNNWFSDHGLEYGAGDETVPLKSNENFLGSEDIIIESNHNNLPTDAQKQIIKELTGQEPETEIRKNIFQKAYMFYRILSPADFIIIAPDGKQLGNNINEINGAYYQNGEQEFALIPDPQDGSYQVKLVGTDAGGSYEFQVSYFEDGVEREIIYSGTIKNGESQQLDFSLSDGGGQISDLTLFIEKVEAPTGSPGDPLKDGTRQLPQDPEPQVLGEKIISPLPEDVAEENSSPSFVYFFSPCPRGRCPEGRGGGSGYYIKNNIRHLIPNQQIFNSWFNDNDIINITQELNLDDYKVGNNLQVKSSSLIKFTNSQKVYIVANNGVIHHISDITAKKLYGSDYQDKVIEINCAFEADYYTSNEIVL